jgi:hypothetical protein
MQLVKSASRKRIKKAEKKEEPKDSEEKKKDEPKTEIDKKESPKKDSEENTKKDSNPIEPTDGVFARAKQIAKEAGHPNDVKVINGIIKRMLKKKKIN